MDIEEKKRNRRHVWLIAMHGHVSTINMLTKCTAAAASIWNYKLHYPGVYMCQYRHMICQSAQLHHTWSSLYYAIAMWQSGCLNEDANMDWLKIAAKLSHSQLFRSDAQQQRENVCSPDYDRDCPRMEPICSELLSNIFLQMRGNGTDVWIGQCAPCEALLWKPELSEEPECTCPTNYCYKVCTGTRSQCAVLNSTC